MALSVNMILERFTQVQQNTDINNYLCEFFKNLYDLGN